VFYSIKKRYKKITGQIQFSNLICRFLYIKLTLFIILFLSSTSLFAGEVTLKWYAPTSNVDGTSLKDLAGYKIYYGTASRVYNGYIDIGNVTTIRIGNLPAGYIYLALTAYDASGNESGYSNEIRKTVLADSDGVSDDEDDSGFIGDNPCTGGNTYNCDDNCSNTYNPDQTDIDGDGVGDACDNCRDIINPDQLDSNSGEDDNTSIPEIQHYGNVCDPDFDNNGKVTKKDKLKFKKYYGKDLPEYKDYLDLDGDAIISKEDIKIWRKYFRKAPGPGSEY
jgi:hypothetical protein